MKTIYIYAKTAALCTMVALLSGNLLHAQSATRFNLVDGQPIHSQAGMDALTTGDKVVMVCPMCQSISMTTYSSDESSKGHVKWMQAGSTKTCALCGGTVTTEVDKDGNTKFVCSKCGDSGFVSAFKTAQK